MKTLKTRMVSALGGLGGVHATGGGGSITEQDG